jgi:hypothetical protein
MKRDDYKTSVIDEEHAKPIINKDAFELNIEEKDIEKKYTFNINREYISIFKVFEEPYIHVFLKALAYYLYKPFYPTLHVDPAMYRKYKADLMAMDYTNEPVCWIECFERDYTKIEYICKHIHVEDFILVEIADDITPFVNELKRKIHYKYHHLITIVNFVPEIIFYIDPEEVVIVSDWYEITEL